MPRIIVTTDRSAVPEEAQVLFDEEVHSVHLSTGHAGGQLLERLAWAVADAEALERARPPLPARSLPRSPRRPLHAPRAARMPIDA